MKALIKNYLDYIKSSLILKVKKLELLITLKNIFTLIVKNIIVFSIEINKIIILLKL